jgi:rare lipoprotein A (peptidoglycan hydrolase)
MTKLIIKNLVNYETNSYLSHLLFLFFILTKPVHRAVSGYRYPQKHSDALYGTASYYANKFEGRLTANGEVFSQQK